MRPCNVTLAAALAAGDVLMRRAEAYKITTKLGTIFRWSTYDKKIPNGLDTYTAQGPFLKRSSWKLTNTMQVPSMTMKLSSLNQSFNGGASLIGQITQGLLDGASVVMTEIYMDATVDAVSVIGDIVIFGGRVSVASTDGLTATIQVKGANNRLDQYAPRRLYQVGCNNTFCDAGCTLLRASFTSSFTVGASPTRLFVPWASPPGTPSQFVLGTLTMTSGAASGESVTVGAADASGCTLVFPLYAAPAPGDTFTVFQGCDKTIATCTGRSNNQNGLWFPFIPPAETAV
jgi:uncharacterized phage protein (TIGR02218 family)